MQTGLIYGLFDPRNDQLRYVGKTSRNDLAQRLREHLWPSGLRKKTHKNHWLRGLLAEGFKPTIEVLEECASESMLDETEQFLIEYLRFVGCNLTNLAAGGEGLRRGSRMSEETRVRMAAAHTGRPRAAFTAEHRANMSAARLGKGFGEIARAHMSAGQKKRRQTHPRTLRPLIDQHGIHYQSPKHASEATGVSLSNVYEVANGNYKQCKGFVFNWTPNLTGSAPPDAQPFS